VTGSSQKEPNRGIIIVQEYATLVALGGYLFGGVHPANSCIKTQTNPRFFVAKFPRFGKTPAKSADGTPNHEASVAPY